MERQLIFRGVGSLVLLAISRGVAQELSTLTGGAFAEGYSSPDLRTPAELAYRVFTTSSTDCEELKTTPTRLEASPNEITMRVGEEFQLSTLAVLARDASSRVVPRVPLALTIVYERDTLKFESDQFTHFSITGLKPSNMGRVIVQILCGRGEYSISIPIRVMN